MSTFPVFVDNIPASVQTKELRQLFSKCGRVTEVTLLPDNKGFVNYACPDDAMDATIRFRNYPFCGKKLFVTSSKELDEFIHQRDGPTTREYLEHRELFQRRPHQYSYRRHSTDHYSSGYHHRQHRDHREEKNRDNLTTRYGHRGNYRDKHHDYYRDNYRDNYHRYPETSRSSRTRSFDEREKRSSENERAPVKRKIYMVSSPQRDEREDSEESTSSKSSSRHRRRRSSSRATRSSTSRSKSRETNRSKSPAKDLRDIIKKAKRAKTEEKDEENDYYSSDSDDEEKTDEKDENSKGLENIEEDVEEEEEEEDEEDEEIIGEELKISNLDHPVEESDLEELLNVFGEISDIQILNDMVLVKMNCSHESIEEAIHTLDQSQWMDNESIRVRLLYDIMIWSSNLNKDSFKNDMMKIFAKYGTVRQVKMNKLDTLYMKIFCSKDEIIQCLTDMNDYQYKKHPIRVKFLDDSDNDFELADQIKNYPKELVPKSFLSSSDSNPKSSKKQIRELWLWIPSPNLRKSFLNDMETVVSQYGKIKEKGWENSHVFIQLESSEKQAVKCVSETQGLPYKSEKVRIKFAENTPENELHKNDEYSIILRNYDKVIIPNDPQPKEKKEIRKNRETISEDRSLSPPQKPKITIGPINSHALLDSNFIAAIAGSVYSASSKMILTNFNTMNGTRLARLKPGHMYINGRENLGHLIRDSKIQEWPDRIKQMLQIGSEVIMDVKRLSKEDEDEMFELTHERVYYDVCLLWKSSKPDLVIKQNMPSFKATVVKLWPQWALLQPLIHGGDQKLILMTKQNYHTPEIDEIKSLIKHVEIGDTLAVLAKLTDYLPIAEKARALEFFEERIDNIKYEANLAWHLATEIDPYNVINKKKADQESANFLASKERVNLPLPKTPDPKFKRWKGYIEELHIPDGGIIRLTESKAMHWEARRQRVYFHRSRLFVNGVKIYNQDILEEQVAVGDVVQVDLIINQIDLTAAYVSQVDVHWVAISVKANVSERGVLLANKLRSEGVDPSVYETKVCQGRVVYFKKPEYGDFTNSGLVVIDSGPYAGQRIDFEAENCYLYGYNLARVDLSYIFTTNEPVCIMVKDYNSYILDKLWIGTDIKNNPTDQDAKMQLNKYLFDHGLEMSSFQNLLKGQAPSRPFIPLQGQVYKGQIKGFKGQSLAEKIVVEANVGEILFFEASREDVYVYGHWMGKADLKYVFDENDEVSFEIHPVYAKIEHQNLDAPQASLVWLGDHQARPKYCAQETSPIMTAQMDSDLWKFVKTKKMDEKMFRALVEGRLPPKEKSSFDSKTIVAEVETPDGSKIKVDNELLSQAALLKQMKETFGSDALMKAMMLLVDKKPKDENDTPSSTSNNE